MLIGLGAASFERGDIDQAVQRVSAACELAPDDPAAYLFLGKIDLAQNGSPGRTSDEIIAALHRFVTAHPENAAANYYYAVALWKRGKVDGNADSAANVESLLHTALRLDPQFAAAHLQLGIMYSEKREFETAIAELQQAVASSTKNVSSGANSTDSSSMTAEEAHYRMAQAYRQTGQPEKAKAELDLYNRMTKESDKKIEQQHRELGQFLYTLRDQPSNQ